jgi:hypothetical protein
MNCLITRSDPTTYRPVIIWDNAMPYLAYEITTDQGVAWVTQKQLDVIIKNMTNVTIVTQAESRIIEV